MDIYILHFVTSLVFFIGTSAQEICNGCDCTISEDIDVPPVVRSVKLTCHEGSVTWYNPIGALRLEVSPTATKGFRLCFIMESGNAAVKLSHERDEPVNVKSPTNRQQYLLSESNLKTIFKGSGASKEHCMSSSEPVILYLEPELSGRLGYQKIFLQYDVIPQSEVKEPSIDDCLPCNEAEILRAYCSSDFVVVGSMTSVEHFDITEKTHIEVSVSQIVRQRGSHFHRQTRDSPTLQGIIVAPRMCGVVKGDGLFLMTGKVRFGELKLGCAPYLHEWEKMVQAAELAGRMECSRD